jgi:hypothetical protein
MVCFLVIMVLHEGKAQRDYYLTHGELSQLPEGGKSEKANVPAFQEDFRKGFLIGYDGFVAYHKGVLCGQARDGRELLETTQRYYGSSNLAVFRVPQGDETIDDVLKDGRGQF